jgi:hypothetical protein
VLEERIMPLLSLRIELQMRIPSPLCCRYCDLHVSGNVREGDAGRYESFVSITRSNLFLVELTRETARFWERRIPVDGQFSVEG